MKTVYLAAAYERNEEMRGVRDVLEAIGYKVTSRWIDQHGGTQTRAITTDELRSNPGQYAHYAQDNLDDLSAAETVILFTEGGRGGRHTEFGAAIAWRKRLIVVGLREHVFHALPEVEWFPNWSRLVMALS